MARRVFRWRAGNLYDTGEQERWLEARALEGLHVKRLYGRVTEFEKGEPWSVKYRFEWKGAMPESQWKERMEMYLQAGWAYAAETKEFYLFKSIREDAKELHTDAAVKKMLYDWRYRQMQGAEVWNLLSLCMMGATIWWPKNGLFWRTGNSTIVVLFVLIVLLWLWCVRDWWYLRKVLRSM